ncbi:MAG: hypothetical protein V3V97_17620 [Hyphomicrobiaceae bacterium]
MLRLVFGLTIFLVAFAPIQQAFAAKTPAIRISARNHVPRCVTPARLMAFVTRRNRMLDRRFSNIAAYYKHHGDALGVRWDYAFFQMLIETNYLKYRTPRGRMGDVHPRQNNFAGLGATGGGEPGEKFPNVSTGVLAHLQHVLMYSGTRIQTPVANRTRLVQDWLLPWSQSFDRPVTFTDLTRRWSPSDKGYSNDIAITARQFFDQYCRAPGSDDVDSTASIKVREIAKPMCRVWTARYENGRKALLIRSNEARVINYTALAVETGRETAQANAFISLYARGGRPIAEFGSYEQALNKAFELCPKG